VIQSWNKVYPYLFRNAASNPDEKRKGQILSSLILGASLIWIVISLVDVVELILNPVTRNIFDLVTDIATMAVFIPIWMVNWRGHVRAASYSFLIFILIACVIFFPMSGLDEVMIVYSIPIMIASFLIRPGASFFLAVLSTVSYSTVYLHSQTSESYNYISVPIFFLIALLAWLVASRLEKAMADISQREELYKTMFDSNRAIQLLVDPYSSAILDANQAACEYYGYSLEEMEKQHIPDLDGKTIARVQEILIRIQAGEITYYETTAKTARGEWHDVEIYPSIMQIRGKTSAYLIIHDITERKKAEELARSQSKRIELLYEASRIFSSTLDLKVIYTTIHDFIVQVMPCASLFVSSYDPEEKMIRGAYGWVDQNEIDASQLPPIPLEEEGHGVQSRVIRSGESMLLPDYEIYMNTAASHYYVDESGKTIHETQADIERAHSGILVPLKVGGDVVGVVQVLSNKFGDYDEQQLHFLEALATHASSAITNARLFAELEKRFEERSEQLDDANRELDTFTYSLSHDLQAPVRGINGFAQILKESYTNCLPEEAQKYLNLIQSNAQKMNQLTEGLLALSRLEHHSLNIQLVSPRAIVEQVLDELRPVLDERQAKINLSELPQVKADPTMLRQVYLNLLSNALKFTRQRQAAVIEIGYLIHAPSAAEIGPAEEIKKIIYFVRDNGVGFDSHYANHLFGVFQRLHSSQQFEGSGVGLSIVRRIVNRHGGRVWAESEVDHGATFYFTLGDMQED
jgi:PAS domain S-box-containing protein